MADAVCFSFGFCMLASVVLYKLSGLVGSHGRTIVYVSLIVGIVGAYSARTVLRNEGEGSRMRRVILKACQIG